jgi:hypothetical protein
LLGVGFITLYKGGVMMVKNNASEKASVFLVRPNITMTTSQFEAYLDEVEKQKQVLQADGDN